MPLHYAAIMGNTSSRWIVQTLAAAKADIGAEDQVITHACAAVVDGIFCQKINKNMEYSVRKYLLHVRYAKVQYWISRLVIAMHKFD